MTASNPDARQFYCCSDNRTITDPIASYVVENIADLRAMSTSIVQENEVAQTLGYYEAGDGGGNLFYWHATDVNVDNNGSNIKAADRATGRWKALSPDFNVKKFGARGDDAADDTVAFNAAATAAGPVRGTVFVPTGPGFTYHIQGQINLPTLVALRGESFLNPSLHVKTGASPATAIIVGGVGVTIENLRIKFDQPDTGDINVIEDYKPAISVASHARISNLFIAGAWDGIVINAGQTHVRAVSLEAFNIGIKVDNAADTVRLNDIQFTSLELTGAQHGLYSNTNVDSYSILVGRCDNLVVSGCLFLNGGRSISTDLNPSSDPYVAMDNCWMDGPSLIEVTKGYVSVATTSMPCGGTHKVVQSGGNLAITGALSILSGNGVSNAGLVELSAGFLNFSGSVFNYLTGASLDQSLVIQTGGTFNFTGNTINRGTGDTYNKPTLHKTGGNWTVTSNKHSGLSSGSGTFILCTGSTANDVIGGNIAPGWSNTIPVGGSFPIYGYITSSSAIKARVYNSAAISIPHVTSVALTFDTELFDTHAQHSTSANTSRLTCVVPGSYDIKGSISFAVNASGGRQVYIRLNGSVILAANVFAAAPTQETDIIVATSYDLAVGDYVELIAYQTSGVTLSVSANSSYSPHFMWTRQP